MMKGYEIVCKLSSPSTNTLTVFNDLNISLMKNIITRLQSKTGGLVIQDDSGVPKNNQTVVYEVKGTSLRE